MWNEPKKWKKVEQSFCTNRRFSISTQTYFGFSNDKSDEMEIPQRLPSKIHSVPEMETYKRHWRWHLKWNKRKENKRGRSLVSIRSNFVPQSAPPLPQLFPYLNGWYAVSLAISNVSAQCHLFFSFIDLTNTGRDVLMRKGTQLLCHSNANCGLLFRSEFSSLLLRLTKRPVFSYVQFFFELIRFLYQR